MVQESFEFRAEIQQLLNILVHSLYTEREIFVRELISNAADALNRVKFEMLTRRDLLDPDVELGIHLTVDEENSTITVSDTGIGMTREEMIENLGTIAQSGAAAFVKRLQEARAADKASGKADDHMPALEVIGQFGVGFYSAFMVAEKVRVVSRSYQLGAEAVEWASDGSATYSIGSADKTTRGTDVIVELKEDAGEFAHHWRLEQIVQRHSDFVPFPITISRVGSTEQDAGDRIVNRQRPLWRQPPREVEEDAYNEFYRHLTMDPDAPVLASHLVADVPVDIRAVLYVPSQRQRSALDPRADYGLRLYARGVLIQANNKDMLPGYLRFVEGVVESEDLPLNVSRETVQRNPAVRRIQKALIGKLVRDLRDLSNEHKQAYDSFWSEFGVFFKEGVATDFVNKDDLLPLLRFHSSGSPGGELVSLSEYVERMGEEQTDIYYLLGEDLQTVSRSPHLDYFGAHGIEVLTLVDPIDSFLVAALTEFDGHSLRNIDDASLELPEIERDEEDDESGGPADRPLVPDNQYGPLVARVMTTLGQRVTQVRESRVLRDHPCRLVTPEGQPGQEMLRVYKLLNQEYEIPAKVFEINRRHPLIHNLAEMVTDRANDPVIEVTIEQMYENQLLVEGLHPNPAAMIPRLQKLMEAATRSLESGSGGS
jgi:molecular chaperone HtpG